MVAVNILLGCVIGLAAAVALMLHGMPAHYAVKVYFLTSSLALLLSIQHLRHAPATRSGRER